jgi:hypothetical protein
VLVRRGDTVRFNVARTLHLINLQRREVARLSTVIGIALLLVLMVFGWWRLLGRFVGAATASRHLSMVYLLMLLFTALDRVGVFVATAVASSMSGPVLSVVDAYLWGLPYAAGRSDSLRPHRRTRRCPRLAAFERSGGV